ncbi:MAG: GNAT family N-acetyltransferase [Microbacteriaceae bacterium]
MAKEFTNETDARRYAYHLDGELIGVLDYALTADAISFTRSFTAPKHRGKGYAGELVEFAVNDVEKSGDRRVVPMCWYVGQWFDDHPERADLLTR